MKQIARLDYLDLQIYDEQRTTLIIPQIDVDGIPYQSTLLTNDALAHELFDLLEMPQQNSAWGSKVLYQADSKEVFISSRPFQKSMQFKGIFFLQGDAIEKLRLVIDFLKKRKIKFLISRLDISFIVQENKIYQALDRCDFKKLTQFEMKKKKEVIYYKVYNSRFSMVAYGKTAQIKKEKGKDYLQRFLKFYELESMPDDLINIELRVLGTDSCAELTEQIINGLNLEKIKAMVLAFSNKRIKLTKKIHNLLKKSPI